MDREIDPMSVWAMVKEKTSFGPTTIILSRKKEEEGGRKDHVKENREGRKTEGREKGEKGRRRRKEEREERGAQDGQTRVSQYRRKTIATHK